MKIQKVIESQHNLIKQQNEYFLEQKENQQVRYNSIINEINAEFESIKNNLSEIVILLDYSTEILEKTDILPTTDLIKNHVNFISDNLKQIKSRLAL